MAPHEKAVIFSQWTSFLDIAENELRQCGHFICRSDGTMSADARTESMEKFDSEECNSFQTPRFILCSLHAWYGTYIVRTCHADTLSRHSGTGINLTRGNVVFMMDPWCVLVLLSPQNELTVAFLLLGGMLQRNFRFVLVCLGHVSTACSTHLHSGDGSSSSNRSDAARESHPLPHGK
jgi:Helicase conserved C-terminal domain